jgi:hypothetical protein
MGEIHEKNHLVPGGGGEGSDRVGGGGGGVGGQTVVRWNIIEPADLQLSSSSTMQQLFSLPGDPVYYIQYIPPPYF